MKSQRGISRVIGPSRIYSIPIQLNPEQYTGSWVYGDDGQIYYSDGLEWQTVVLTTGDQNIDGKKTFEDDVTFDNNVQIGTDSDSGQILNDTIATALLQAATNLDPGKALFVDVTIDYESSTYSLGDVNRNDDVSSQDALEIQKYIDGVQTDPNIIDYIENALIPYMLNNFSTYSAYLNVGLKVYGNVSTTSLYGNTNASINFPEINTLSIETADIEHFRVTSDGNVLIGTTTDNGVDKLQINGSVSVNGILSATDFNYLSDITLKSNIKNINNALDMVKNIRGVSFDWKENGKPAIGVIAQEIETVIPQVVNVLENQKKTVSYGNIIAVLIEAIKELSEKVDILSKK